MGESGKGGGRYYNGLGCVEGSRSEISRGYNTLGILAQIDLGVTRPQDETKGDQECSAMFSGAKTKKKLKSTIDEPQLPHTRTCSLFPARTCLPACGSPMSLLSFPSGQIPLVTREASMCNSISSGLRNIRRTRSERFLWVRRDRSPVVRRRGVGRRLLLFHHAGHSVSTRRLDCQEPHGL